MLKVNYPKLAEQIDNEPIDFKANEEQADDAKEID